MKDGKTVIWAVQNVKALKQALLRQKITQTLLNTELAKFQSHFPQSTWPGLCSRKTSGLTSTSVVSCGPHPAGRGNRRIRGQCQKLRRMRMTRHGWTWGTLEEAGQRTQNSTGMHQGKERRQQVTTFIPCAFLQRLPGPNTALLSANTHETRPVTSHPSPQLVYRWVLAIISSFSSLCPRSVWDLKMPQACWVVTRFHSHHHRTTHSPLPDLL